MGKAWDDASRMIGSNRELVAVIAGIFFFLPLLLLFQIVIGYDWNFGTEPTPEQIEALFGAFLAANWWVVLIALMAQLCGTIAILSLLSDSQNPTVGEAMTNIPKLALPVLAAQILVTLVTQSLPLIAGLLPEMAAATLGIVANIVSVYISIKFSLVVPQIVLGKDSNPISALGASWRLTKGNSLRIFGFYLAIGIVAFLLALIVFILVGLALALIGPPVQSFGTAAVIAVLGAIYSAVSVAVMAAIYRQLSGKSGQSVEETFD